MTTGKWPTPALVLSLLLILCSFGTCVSTALATDIVVTGQFNFTDNRSVNPAGAFSGYLIAVGATGITPSGPGTTVRATQGATTINVPFLPSTAFPNNYFGVTFDLSLTGAWTLTASDAAGPVSIQTNAIPNPEVIPLVNNLQVGGPLLTPHVSWTLPDFTGLGVTRIFLRVRDLDHFINGASDIIFTSAFLAPTATSFDIPANVLSAGKHYSFDVLVDNIVTPPSGPGFLSNRSETFTGVYSTPEASTLILLGLGATGLTGVIRRRRRRM